ncbi:endonuclease/exonuclease/phosphatase family protein [Streptomyces noursei]|nr:endonuclease/exonuclease/phosphatase [Streptomyces noursei ATCC 11455]ANZ21881.1 endonuclease/exonuclease/phosphatase [Streptomyces noursei ATCC 11455]MCZ0996485.1 endonuclease/exonuclease/phosphatase family protein [Streptomyces noursei]
MNLRAVTWNLFLGGLDGADETRLGRQAEILSEIDADIVCLPECNRWDEDNEGRLWWMAHTLGLQPVAMVRSRLGTPPVQNHTALLYRPSKLRLMGRAILGRDVFHHALIRARLRPVEEHDDQRDFLVLATHLSYTDGDTRLREARWMTDYGGKFPGAPPRAMLLGDLNVPDREPASWSLIPANMHSRYRLVLGNGEFGGADRRALQVLLRSGWEDPQALTGEHRTATVGYYYETEPVPWSLDYALVNDLSVKSYYTHDTPQARKVSDHLPAVIDVEMGR